MNLLHFFTLGYYPEYLFIGIIFGIVIGIYGFFRVRYSLNSTKLSKKKKISINLIVAILAFICCLNIWSSAAILTLYLFFASIIADIIRIVWKYLLEEKYPNLLPKYHKKGILALIIFAV